MLNCIREKSYVYIAVIRRIHSVCMIFHRGNILYHFNVTTEIILPYKILYLHVVIFDHDMIIFTCFQVTRRNVFIVGL